MKRKSSVLLLSLLSITFMFTSLQSRPATSLVPAQPYKVLIYNDEYHSIPEAAHILSSFVTDRVALHAAVTAHSEGRAVIAEFAEEAAAISFKERIQTHGLSAAVENPSV